MKDDTTSARRVRPSPRAPRSGRGAGAIRWAPFILLFAALASSAPAQQRLDTMTMRVRYLREKGRTQLTDEQKADLTRIEARIDKLRREENEPATRLALTEALYRLRGQEWTDADALRLALRFEAGRVLDPESWLAFGNAFAIEGTRDSAYRLKPPVGLRIYVAKSEGRRRGAVPGETVKDLYRSDNVMPDVHGRSLLFKWPLQSYADGPYLLAAEITEAGELFHRFWTPIQIAGGIEAAGKEIEERLENIQGADHARASIRYPFWLARAINSGKREMQGYDFAAGMERSERLMTQLEFGNDELYRARGNRRRHYYFEDADEIMPYRVYVPRAYDRRRKYPLVIGLHGNGGTNDTFMDRDEGALAKIAEERGYIVATPLGYRPNGGYGSGSNSPYPGRRRTGRLSEADVMNVLELVRAEYSIDEDRVYLFGHSMGGNGTWTIGSRHPEVWAALGPIAAGQARPRLLRGIEHVAVIVVHGDADTVAPVRSSRAMVEGMKELSLEHKYIEVEGGTHGSVVGPNLPKIFDFFDAHRRRKP